MSKAAPRKSSGALTLKGTYCLSGQRRQAGVTTQVRGYVVDRRTGEHLAANVNVVGVRIGTVANEQGYFQLAVPAGECRFSVAHLGNTTLVTRPITLPENSLTEVVFYVGTTIIH